MTHALASGLLLLGGVGVGLVALQVLALRRHLGVTPLRPRAGVGVSVLKPLCGLDDDLMANLETFSDLDFEHYEVLLGVRDTSDPAFALACSAARRWPKRMRVVLQHGEPGLNPKVNQLITLAEHARHDVLVVSDSNIAVEPGYLQETAALLEDPQVGLVTHPIAGRGGGTLGARLDNAFVSGVVAPGMVAARVIARRALVVGKSMALRRADLDALGGFAAVKDVLAEDHVMGQLVEHGLRKRVAVAHTPIVNVVRSRTLRAFCDRYTRWGTIQRRSVGLAGYVGGLFLLNPIPMALFAFALTPRPLVAVCAIACFACKLELERAARRSLGVDAPLADTALVVLCKDLLLVLTWSAGLLRNVVVWRGNRLAVLAGTRLVPIETSRNDAHLPTNRAVA